MQDVNLTMVNQEIKDLKAMLDTLDKLRDGYFITGYCYNDAKRKVQSKLSYAHDRKFYIENRIQLANSANHQQI